MAGISTTLLEVVAEYTCHRVDYDYKNNRPVAVRFVGMDDLQVDHQRRVGVGLHLRSRPLWRCRETGGITRRGRSRASLPATLGMAGVRAE